MVGRKAIYTIKTPTHYINGEWQYKIEEVEVSVMAIVDGYAMVRRKWCLPFVCKATELRQDDHSSIPATD